MHVTTGELILRWRLDVDVVCVHLQETSRRLLHFSVPRVVAVSPHMRLVEDNPASLSLLDIYKQVRAAFRAAGPRVRNYLPRTSDSRDLLRSRFRRSLGKRLFGQSVPPPLNCTFEISYSLTHSLTHAFRTVLVVLWSRHHVEFVVVVVSFSLFMC